MDKKLAILIPYRDRQEHLQTFVTQALPFVKSQVNNCDLYIIEQEQGKRFNRGMLFNCGFDIIKTQYDYLCFHDVDLIPEDSDYRFSEAPTHLSKYCSQFDYKLLYPELFGGVMIITPETFKKINGFNNEYWGWGVEDDDLRDRIEHYKIKWNRREGKYCSLDHIKNEHNNNGVVYDHVKKNRDMYFSNKRKKNYKSGLSDLKYSLIKTEHADKYIKYTVSI